MEDEITVQPSTPEVQNPSRYIKSTYKNFCKEVNEMYHKLGKLGHKAYRYVPTKALLSYQNIPCKQALGH
eukprot:5357727-Amphidinium_carterae.1